MTQTVASPGLSRSSKRRSAQLHLVARFLPNHSRFFEAMDVSLKPAHIVHLDLTLPPPDSEKPLPPVPVHIPLALRRLKLPLISRRTSSIYSSADDSAEELGETSRGWWNAPLTPRSQRRMNHSAVVIGSGNGSSYVQLHSPASSSSRMASPLLPEPSPDSEESPYFKQFRSAPPPPTPANDSIPLLNYPLAPHVQAAFSAPDNGIWSGSPARSPYLAPGRQSPMNRISKIPSIVDEYESNEDIIEAYSRPKTPSIQEYDHEAMVQGYRDLAPSPVHATTPKFFPEENETTDDRSVKSAPTITEQIAQIRRNTEAFRSNRSFGPSTPTGDLELRLKDSHSTLSDVSDLSDISEVSTSEESFLDSRATEDSKVELSAARISNATRTSEQVSTRPPPSSLSLFPPVSPLYPPRVSSRNTEAIRRPKTDLGRLPQISTVVEASSRTAEEKVNDGQKKMRRRRGVVVTTDTALIPEPLSPRRPLASHQVTEKDVSPSDELISIPSMTLSTPTSTPVLRDSTSTRRSSPAHSTSSTSTHSHSTFHRSPVPSLTDFSYAGVFTPPRHRLSAAAAAAKQRTSLRSSAVALLQRHLKRARNSLSLHPSPASTTPPEHRRILSLPGRKKPAAVARPPTPLTPHASPSTTLVNDTSPVYFPAESPKYKKLPPLPPQRTRSLVQRVKDSRRHKALKKSIQVIGPVVVERQRLEGGGKWLVPSPRGSPGRAVPGWV